MTADGDGAGRIVIKALPASRSEAGEPGLSSRTVYCVPSAGTGARGFLMPFARSPLRKNLRVVQLPGREDRFDEPCLQDIPEMAELVAAAIAAEGVDDYALFGHSFGAMVMFETARVLERLGAPAPELLAVAACPPPQFTSLIRFDTMDAAEIVAALRDLGGADFGSPRGDELAELIFPALRADCVAFVRYVGTPEQRTIAFPILAMSGTLDTAVTAAKVELWRKCTQSPFTAREYAGGHFFPVESDLPMRAVVEWNP